MNAFMFPTLVDNILPNLEDQVRLVVGKEHWYNISSLIPFANLKRANRGIKKMFPKVAPYIEGETSQQAVARLLGDGRMLGDVGELAQVVAQYPGEIKKYRAVFSLYEGSYWLDEGTAWKNRFHREDEDEKEREKRKDMPAFTFAPFFGAENQIWWFRRFRFDRPLSKDDGIIVFDEKVGSW